jgi:TIR domain
MPEKVFISYAHEDEKVALEVFTALHRSRIALPSIDRVALSPGDSLTGKIGDELEIARVVVVLLSQHSITSNWVLKELKTVRTHGSADCANTA